MSLLTLKQSVERILVYKIHLMVWWQEWNYDCFDYFNYYNRVRLKHGNNTWTFKGFKNYIKKKLAGKNEVTKIYNQNSGVLRDLGELKNTSQQLPKCVEDRFVTFYPFFPYQIHLIPEIVKNLRSAGVTAISLVVNITIYSWWPTAAQFLLDNPVSADGRCENF